MNYNNIDTRLMLQTVLFTPGPHGWGLPILFTGDPGTGKSTMVDRITTELGLHCETVIASLREPADFLGMPWVLDGQLIYLSPTWAAKLNKEGGGVIHFDELSTAPAMVQKALLRVAFERVVGETQLDARVRIVASQNPADMAADGNDLAMPLANRFIHWDWATPSHTEWIDYMLAGSGDEAPVTADARNLEASVMKAWPAQYARAKGLVTGFISKRGELLRKTPRPEDPQASKAWASLRTWEMATRVLAGAEIHGLGTVETQLLLAGCVGDGPIAEFIAYCENADLPDFEALLDGKVKWKSDNRLDRTLAVFQGCAALVCPSAATLRIERAEGLWRLLGTSVDKQADLVFPAAKALCKAKLSQSDAAMEVLYKMEPIMRAAGILSS